MNNVVSGCATIHGEHKQKVIYYDFPFTQNYMRKCIVKIQ